MKILIGLRNWNYLKIMPQLITIIITTLFITIISYIYYYKVRRMKPNENPKGIVLFIELIIKSIEKIIIEVMGIKYKNLTIYLIYLISYILIGNWLAILGFEPQTSMYTVTLSMALITFIGIYYTAIKFQKILFLKKFIINPLEIITHFAPLISLSFRLFGNILGGSIILTMIYNITGKIWSNIPVIGQINLLIGVIGPFLHIYFDLFTGSIQAIIFGILTLVYWKLQMEKKTIIKEKTIKLTEKKEKNKYNKFIF